MPLRDQNLQFFQKKENGKSSKSELKRKGVFFS